LISKVDGNTKSFFPAKTLKGNTQCTAFHTRSVLFSRPTAEMYMITLCGELQIVAQSCEEKRQTQKKYNSAMYADNNKT